MRVAIYCRISKEDEEIKQSESIINQEKSLKRYVEERNWQLVDCYSDDGYSGTNFQRPAFQRMIEDIKKNLIDCVISKDYSRLGREHVQTSYYTEIFFPKNKVRYIAVNDNIDTMHNDDFLSFRAVFNDMYARDISKKIRYTLHNKQKEGAFIGAFAPYGYQKNPQNKNKLLIDSFAASVVQKIFQLYLSGYGKTRIANYLNERKVPSPLANKKPEIKNTLWNALAIKRILENEVYLGHTIQHKKEKISYKIKKQVNVPQEKWLKVEYTHEAIIEQDIFRQVQSLIKKKRNGKHIYQKTNNLFTGLIKCKLCGSNYVYSQDKKKGKILLCGRYKQYYSKGCQKKLLIEKELVEIIKKDLQKWIAETVNPQSLLAKLEKYDYEKQNSLQMKSKNLDKQITDLEVKSNCLYQDRLNGILGEKQFLLFQKRLEEKISFLKEHRENIEEECFSQPQKQKNDLIMNILSLSQLTRIITSNLIEKIEVITEKKVKIYYKFKPP